MCKTVVCTRNDCPREAPRAIVVAPPTSDAVVNGPCARTNALIVDVDKEPQEVQITHLRDSPDPTKFASKESCVRRVVSFASTMTATELCEFSDDEQDPPQVQFFSRAICHIQHADHPLGHLHTSILYKQIDPALRPVKLASNLIRWLLFTEHIVTFQCQPGGSPELVATPTNASGWAFQADHRSGRASCALSQSGLNGCLSRRARLSAGDEDSYIIPDYPSKRSMRRKRRKLAALAAAINTGNVGSIPLGKGGRNALPEHTFNGESERALIVRSLRGQGVDVCLRRGEPVPIVTIQAYFRVDLREQIAAWRDFINIEGRVFVLKAPHGINASAWFRGVLDEVWPDPSANACNE